MDPSETDRTPPARPGIRTLDVLFGASLLVGWIAFQVFGLPALGVRT